MVEKLITVAKKDDLTARREARKILVGHSSSSAKPKSLAGKTELERIVLMQNESLINGEDLVKHLFEVVAPQFRDRNGGYTRLTKTGMRRGDAAVTAVLELVH